MAHQDSGRSRAVPPGRGAAAPEIPDKLYFRIGEVARLCEVPAYVLRFWESEFTQLKPNKGGTGQRLYRRRDVETARRIKTLLYDEGYTIPGARQVIKQETRQKEPQLALIADVAPGASDLQQLRRLKKELKDLHAMLSRPPARSTVQTMRKPRTTDQVTSMPKLQRAVTQDLHDLLDGTLPEPAAEDVRRTGSLRLMDPAEPTIDLFAVPAGDASAEE